MNNGLKRLAALLLVLVMLIGLLPIIAFAENSPDDTWEEIIAFEKDHIKQRRGIGGASVNDYVAIAGDIAEIVMSSDDYKPGTCTYDPDSGNACFFWENVEGEPQGYSPVLRAKMNSSSIDASAATSGETQTVSVAKRGGYPTAKGVYVVGPFYGIDSKFTDQYINEGLAVAEALDTSFTLYAGSGATVDKTANALSNGGVVFFDSHGSTDYTNINDEYDHVSRANTSYIVLNSTVGLTADDMSGVDGPYGRYYPAYQWRDSDGNVGCCVNGEVLARHMTSNAPHSILWIAICLGMATDGFYKPLREKGVEVVYGYSQSVSFGGDYLWEETFWDNMISGKTVAQSISAMKTAYGEWDYSKKICNANGWSNAWIASTITDARNDYCAFPIVASSEDAYPGHGNVDAVQTVRSTYTIYMPAVRESYRISFSAVCDTVSPLDVYIYDEYTLPSVNGTVPGYTFVGWSTAEVNGASSASCSIPGTTVMAMEDRTYYAVFSRPDGDSLLYFTSPPCLHLNTALSGAAAADCTSAGCSGDRVCSDCGITVSYGSVIAAFGHCPVPDAAVAPTCTATGLTAGTHCSRCGEILVTQRPISPLGHTYETVEELPATCLTDGSESFTCVCCGDSYTTVIPATGHKAAQAVEEYRLESTCDKAGHYDRVVYCTICGIELERKTVILPLSIDHKLGSGVVENTVAATCATNGTYEIAAYCTVCGKCIIRIPMTIPATGKHTAAAAVQENAVPATCTAAGSYESVIYCKDCGTELSRETVSISALGHQYGTPVDNGDGTHTVTCSCGDSITQAHIFANGVCTCGAEEVTFGILSAALRLDRNIDIIFTAAVPEGAQNIKLMIETDNETVTLSDYEKDGSDLRFIYADLNPQQIGDVLNATLSAKIDGKTKYDALEDYSIRQYCINILNNPSYSGDVKLHTLLSDLLTYGATAQAYTGYRTDAPATAGLDLTPSTFTPISGKIVSFNGTADAAIDWISAGLVLSDSVTMRFAFCAASTENLSVKVCINGREESFTAFETDANGRYYVDFRGINATEFDDTVSAAFYRNGTAIGRTVNYSVNTYICSTQNSANASLQALVRALCNYGAAAESYSPK